MKTIVIHDNDADGWTSAAIVGRFLNGVINIPLESSKQKDFKVPDCDTLYVVDLSLSKDEVIRLKNTGTKVTIIDHHGTSEWIKEYGGVHDINHSACMLTWLHLFPTQEAPDFVKYVEDRDLWKFSLPKSRQVGYYLSQFRFTSLELVNDLIENFTGSNLERYDIIYDALIARCNNRVDSWKKDPLYIYIDEQRIPIIELVNDISECMQWFRDVLNKDTVASFRVANPGRIVVSLRGKDSRRIAEKYGGGGHDQAAGFSLIYDEFFGRLQRGTGT